MRARVGSVVAGKYRLVERLGGGGMGEVFRADHLYAGRVVALKLLQRDFSQDQDLTRRFFQEAQAVNRIRHPNIVDVLDAGFCEEGPYVAMEILEGASLSAALGRAGRFDVVAALAVILPMLDALDAVHGQGIVHRDLKPENVFLARQAAGVMVKLVDFGIAKVLDAGQKTNTGIVFGTPDYLSPEQASGEGVVDGRSDLFAVGIVLFELLTGRRPFEADTALATAYRIVNSPAPRLTALGVTVDDRVQAALDVALAKVPAERFADAGSFASALAPIAGDGDGRRAALARVVDAVSGLAPTVAAPEPQPLLEERRQAITPVAPPSPALLDPLRAVATLASLASPRPPITRPYAGAAPMGPRETEALRERPHEPSRRSASFSPLPGPSPLPARLISTTPSRISPRSSSVPGRPLSVRRTTWLPRPLPAHVRGKCHTRGSFPRAVVRWIERAFGAEVRDDVLGALPAELAETYRTDGFNALVWYDLDALDTFLEAATALVLGGDAHAWRALARDNFERDLGPIFGSLTSSSRATDAVTLLKRSISAWGRIYDFGSVRVSEPGASSGSVHRALVRFDGFDAASLAVRNATIGTAEGLLKKSTGPTGPTVTGDLASRVLAGESSFVRDFEFEVAWPPRG